MMRRTWFLKNSDKDNDARATSRTGKFGTGLASTKFASLYMTVVGSETVLAYNSYRLLLYSSYISDMLQSLESIK